MNPRRHILLFHQAALGDFVLTWPIAMALGRVFAQSRVAYVTGHDKGRLAEEAIGIEACNVEHGWHTLHGDAASVDPAVRRRLEQTQCVVLFAQNPEPHFIENVQKLAGDIPILALQPNPPPGTHVWDHHLAQMPPGQPLQTYVGQMQRLISERGLGVSSGDANTVFIHPGSGSAKKNWPLDSFVTLADDLTRAGRHVEFLLGEVERDRFSPADVQLIESVAPTHAFTDLPALRARLMRGTIYVGNDSGPTHLAAMLGLTTAVLHGPHSDLTCWHPRGPRVRAYAFETPLDVLRAGLV